MFVIHDTRLGIGTDEDCSLFARVRCLAQDASISLFNACYFVSSYY